MKQSHTGILIKRAFFKTGIYPFNYKRFFYHSQGIREVPCEFLNNVKNAIEQEEDASKRTAAGAPRKDIYTNCQAVI